MLPNAKVRDQLPDLIREFDRISGNGQKSLPPLANNDRHRQSRTYDLKATAGSGRSLGLDFRGRIVDECGVNLTEFPYGSSNVFTNAHENI